MRQFGRDFGVKNNDYGHTKARLRNSDTSDISIRYLSERKRYIFVYPKNIIIVRPIDENNI
jgi:hypothetical protein